MGPAGLSNILYKIDLLIKQLLYTMHPLRMILRYSYSKPPVIVSIIASKWSFTAGQSSYSIVARGFEVGPSRYYLS